MKKHVHFAVLWIWTERLRIARYVITGFSAVAIDASVYFFATRALHLNVYAANFLSVLAGGSFAFISNKLWSFQSQGNTLRQSRRFLGLFIFNYVFQQWGFYVAIRYLHAYDLLAKVLLIGLMVSWNFLIYKYWVYAVE